MTEKIKELNNIINEKININEQINLNNFKKNSQFEIINIERRIFEEELFQIEKKAFQYATNNNFNIKLDTKGLRKLLRYIERTHEGKRTKECMVESVESLLQSVINKN